MEERRKKVDELLKQYGLFGKEMEIAELADWYRSHQAFVLADYCWHATRTMHEFIQVVLSECETLDDVCEVLDNMIAYAEQDCERYQDRGFYQLAEFVMVRMETLHSISEHIERNK